MTTTTETAPDWTVDPETGRSNSSPLFQALTDEVARLIRGEAHALLAGRADIAAQLIMAQLAHVHHLVPGDWPARDEDPNPLDNRLLAMSRILREAVHDDAADEIEVNAAFIREAWRGSDDSGIAEALETIAAYATELARIVRDWPAEANEASSEEGQPDA
jgi:hypothetical protein